jgi:hypothetical protein
MPERLEFEYKFFEYEFRDKENNEKELEELNYLGSNGWELVSVLEIEKLGYRGLPTKYHKYFFKRPV